MKSAPTLRLALLLCALFALTSAAQAQVRYTFVSMTGSDANDCLSATTACRTFQRAHDVVSDGGTVVARDSGGYGTITITKSVTITGEGVEAGLTASGGAATGVTINTANVVVRLRSLTITGANGAALGINYLNGTALHVENCKVTGFTTYGLHMNTPGHLYVSDSVFRSNSTGIEVDLGAGINPGPFGSITIEHTLVEQNGLGLQAVSGKTSIRKSRIAGNSSAGLSAVNPGVEVTLDDCNISHNQSGIDTANNAIVRVANSTIVNNNTGLAVAGGGQILSHTPASNTVEGNATPGAFTGNYTAQ